MLDDIREDESADISQVERRSPSPKLKMNKLHSQSLIRKARKI